MTTPNQANVLDALEKYDALLALERETGTKTTRARNEILRSLNDADLTAFAVIMNKKGTDSNESLARR